MSGVDDTWADARGEYLSAYHASAVYRLLGKKGLDSEATPPVAQPIIRQDVGYHLRAGGHSVEPYDWLRFLDFAEYHLKPAARRPGSARRSRRRRGGRWRRGGWRGGGAWRSLGLLQERGVGVRDKGAAPPGVCATGRAASGSGECHTFC